MDKQRVFRKPMMREGRGRKNLHSRVTHKITHKASPHIEAMLIEAQRISHVGSWVWDLTTDKIQFSEEMFRLVGMFPEEMTITREIFFNFLHPDEVAQIFQEFQHGTSYPFSDLEHRIVLPDGKIRYVHTRVKAYKDENGNPLRLLGSMQDITERKKMEDALKESEWRNRIVSELTTDYIFVVDVAPNGILQLRWASENMSRITGRTVDEAQTSDKWINIIHPDDTVRFFDFINNVLTTAEAGSLECRTFIKQGAERYIRIFVRPQVGEGNKVTTIIGAIQDITGRKQAEESLRVAEADYRTIFEGAPLGIFQSTIDGRFKKVNQTMAEMYGYRSSSEMITDVKSIAGQIYSEPMSHQKFMRLLAEYGEVFGYESLDRHKNGSTFWTSTNARMVKNKSSEFLYYEGFVIDITARKASEVALQKVNEQLRIQLDEIRELQTILRNQAVHDQLTGLYNRHYMQEAIAEEYAIALRKEYPISLIVLDLDHLKEINRRHGHFAGGDIALQRLGEHLKTMSRTEDIVCRHGGDEFLIALHNTPAQVAYERAEQWRKSLNKLKIDSNGIKFKISFSAGIATFPAHGKTIEEVMHAADKALYQAKELGRNCVVVYSA